MCIKLKIFRVDLLVIKEEKSVLVRIWRKILIKFEGYISVTTNIDFILNIIRVDFQINLNNNQKLRFVARLNLKLDYIKILILFK